ncbi:MAG: serine protein kinase RIO [Conexivisphaera sp.]
MSGDWEEHEPRKVVRDLLRRERRDRIKLKDADDYKVVEGVLDSRTLMSIYSLMKGGYLASLKGVVKSGKEARVYWGTAPDGADVAVKIYYAVASQFKRRLIYIEGDPRFKEIKRDPHGIAEAWARKEYANLKQARDAGIRVPAPIAVKGNVLVMQFIGEAGRPAPLLMESEVEERDYLTLLHYIRELWRKAMIVHADLSEYNVFKWRGELVLFDFGSSVDVGHPMAADFLRRDVETINRFFGSRGIAVRDAEEVLGEVLG